MSVVIAIDTHAVCHSAVDAAWIKTPPSLAVSKCVHQWPPVHTPLTLSLRWPSNWHHTKRSLVMQFSSANGTGEDSEAPLANCCGFYYHLAWKPVELPKPPHADNKGQINDWCRWERSKTVPPDSGSVKPPNQLRSHPEREWMILSIGQNSISDVS